MCYFLPKGFYLHLHNYLPIFKLKSIINVLEVLKHFNKINDDGLLNQLFYCSLLDF
jgi:hypothetical protein